MLIEGSVNPGGLPLAVGKSTAILAALKLVVVEMGSFPI